MVCKKKPAVKRKTTKKTARKSVRKQVSRKTKGNWDDKWEGSEKEWKNVVKAHKHFKKISSKPRRAGTLTHAANKYARALAHYSGRENEPLRWK